MIFGFLKNKDTIDRKRFTLNHLISKSTASITKIQSATNKLVTINDSIDKTTHEIEKIEANFSLIKGELNQRKTSNAAIIAKIKSMGENDETEQNQTKTE